MSQPLRAPRSVAALTPRERRGLRIAGILRGEPLLGPQSVHVDLVNACNTRCLSCWHHSPLLRPERRPSPSWLRQRMAPAAFRALLDDLEELGGCESRS